MHPFRLRRQVIAVLMGVEAFDDLEHGAGSALSAAFGLRAIA